MTRNGTLSAKQERLIATLVAGRNVEQAAREVGVGRRTAFTWLRNPDFADALAKARREAFENALREAQVAAAEAVATLRCIMKVGDTHSVRVRACEAVLNVATRASELLDLSARIQALEEYVNEETSRPLVGNRSATATAQRD